MTRLSPTSRPRHAIDELAERLRGPRRRGRDDEQVERPSRRDAIVALVESRRFERDVREALVGAPRDEVRRASGLLLFARQARLGARLALRHAAWPRSRWQLPRVRLARTVARAARRPVITVATVDAGDDPGGGDDDDDGTGRDPDATAGRLSTGVGKTQTETTRWGRFADA